jgi:hypothetical protein
VSARAATTWATARRGAWVWLAWLKLAACALVLASGREAQAHQELVGVLQAKVSGEQVEVLLKLDVRKLLVASGVSPDEDGDPSKLLSPDGQRAVWDLLLREHKVSTEREVCTREAITLYDLSKSRRWLDVIARYRCPAPRQHVDVELRALLDGEGHTVMAHFDKGDGVIDRFVYSKHAKRYRFTWNPAPPQVAAPLGATPPSTEEGAPPTPAPRGWPGLLWHGEVFLVGLVVAGACSDDRKARAWGLAVGFGALALGLLVPTAWVWRGGLPSVLGMVALGVQAQVLVRHWLVGHPLRAHDYPLVALVGLCAGLGVAQDGSLWVEGRAWWGPAAVIAGGGALSALGWWAHGRPRAHRGVAFGALAWVGFLLLGELARLVEGGG